MELIKINLLPKEHFKAEENREFLWLSFITVLVAAVFGAVIFALRLHSYSILSIQIEQAKAEALRYDPIIKQLDAMETTRKALETKKSVIIYLRERGVIYPKLMEDFVAVLPQGISLRSMFTKLLPDGRIAVTISGDSINNYPIADLITKLTLKGSFSDMELGTITATHADNAPTISAFTLNFSYQEKK